LAEFDLSFDQLGCVHEIKNMYRLDHKTGIIFIRKRELSDDEVETLNELKMKISGWPENRSPSI